MASRIDDDSGNGPTSFRTLYRGNSAFVMRLLVRWLARNDRPPESARDLHQNVFLTLASILKREVVENVRALLVSLAFREVQNHLRRKRAVADGGDAAEAAPASARNPEQWAIAREEMTMVDDLLSKMTAGAREVLRRVDIDGDTCAEIAAEQARHDATVTSQLSRARKRFAELVREQDAQEKDWGNQDLSRSSRPR